PAFTFDLDSHQAVSLGLFLLIAAINVGLVSLLDRAIERIATQAHNIRVVIESAPAGIVVVDDQGTIQLLNSSAEKQFGYARSELLGKKVSRSSSRPRKLARIAHGGRRLCARRNTDRLVPGGICAAGVATAANFPLRSLSARSARMTTLG